MEIYLDLLKYICICGLSFFFGCWFVLWCSWNVLIENGHFIQMSQSLFNWASYLFSLPIGICSIAAGPNSHIMADHVWPQNVNKHLQVFFLDYCEPFVLKNNSVCSLSVSKYSLKIVRVLIRVHEMRLSLLYWANQKMNSSQKETSRKWEHIVMIVALDN